MDASIKFLPGATIRWRRRRYVIVDYAGLDAIVAHEFGKHKLERIPVEEAQSDRTSQRAERICFANGKLRQTDVDQRIARSAGVVANAVDPFDAPKKIVFRKVVDRVNGFTTGRS